MAAAYLNNDNIITLPTLTLKSNGSNVTTATLSAQLYKADYTTTVGSPFSLTYVSNTNSEYQGTLPYVTAATLTETTKYVLQITGTASGIHLELWVPLIGERFIQTN